MRDHLLFGYCLIPGCKNRRSVLNASLSPGFRGIPYFCGRYARKRHRLIVHGDGCMAPLTSVQELLTPIC